MLKPIASEAGVEHGNRSRLELLVPQAVRGFLTTAEKKSYSHFIAEEYISEVVSSLEQCVPTRS